MQRASRTTAHAATLPTPVFQVVPGMRGASLVERISTAAGRAVCPVSSHQLTSPAMIRRVADGEPLDRTDCTRCGLTSAGDWSRMERLGAWGHYRSSF
jgi:hypothetical protein